MPKAKKQYHPKKQASVCIKSPQKRHFCIIFAEFAKKKDVFCIFGTQNLAKSKIPIALFA
jgi:hypothetical protein